MSKAKIGGSIVLVVMALILIINAVQDQNQRNLDVLRSKLERSMQMERDEFARQLEEKEKNSKSQQEKFARHASRISAKIEDANQLRKAIEDEQSKAEELRRKLTEEKETELKKAADEKAQELKVAGEEKDRILKEADEIRDALAMAMPTKRTTPPTEDETEAALSIMFELLRKEDLVPGELIAVIGRNIEPLVERLLNNKTDFPHGSSATIFGGETIGSDVEALQQKYKTNKFFSVDETHPVPAVRAALATDSVDVFIVWDLDNGLNAAHSYKSLAHEAHRSLRANAGVSSRTAIFVIGQKALPMKNGFPADQLSVKEVAHPSRSPFSVHLLERGGGVGAKSRWQGLNGMDVVRSGEFLDKCRSPDEHMLGLDVLLRIVADVLEECGITYWLDSGTLLGAYRFNAYNPMEDDHDLIVDHDEFIEQTHPFRGKIVKRFAQINRQARFIAIDGKPEHYKELIGQLFMSKDGTISGPQIDLIPAKWDEDTSKYNIPVAHFHRQTKEGFPKKILFSQKATKWKTKHGYLRSLPILGREYPAPYDVEGYSAVWYSKSDFMNFIVLRQMKENKEGNARYCRDSYAKVFAPKDVSSVRKMVARNKELFPISFNATSCPLCKCSHARCYVPKLDV